jgi:CRISPR-associated protein Csm5
MTQQVGPSVFKKEKLSETVALQLKALSPIHVGAAGEKLMIENIDFLWERGTLYILDQKKLLNRLLEAEGLLRFEKMLRAGQFDNMLQFLEDQDIGLEEVSQKIIKIKDVATDIRPQIRDGMGRPYLPGSSIKGALRSAIFEHLYRQNDVQKPQPTKDVRTGQTSPLRGEDYDKAILENFDRAITRYIRPSDAYFDQTTIANISLFNLYNDKGQWESDYKNFMVSAEVFPTGATGKFQLSLSIGLFDLYKNHYRSERLPRYFEKVLNLQNPTGFLLSLINYHTARHLEREIEFFQKFSQAEDTKFIIQSLETILEKVRVNDGKSAVLRLSYGSGFHGITGDWQFKNHVDTIKNSNPRRWYKSRKTIGRDAATSLMGFLEIHF